MAKNINLSSKTTRKRRDYWQDFANLARELKKFIRAHRVEAGYMPTTRGLRAAGQRGLENAIQHHGGQYTVARRLGLKVKISPAGYVLPLPKLRAEINKVAGALGVRGAMPTEVDFLQAGRDDLLRAIRAWGGQGKVAKRLHLKRKPAKSYMPLPKLRAEINKVAGALGARGAMPTEVDFLQAGREDLLRAIHKWGGPGRVAKRLRLKRKRARSHMLIAPRNETWLRIELGAFAKAQKLDGKMPSARQLLAAGRRDLYNSIRGMGGFSEIAQRLGWTLQRVGSSTRWRKSA